MQYSIFPVNLQDYISSNLVEFKMTDIKGVPIQYYEDEQGRKVVNRIMGTSLNAYLDERYQPGAILEEE